MRTQTLQDYYDGFPAMSGSSELSWLRLFYEGFPFLQPKLTRVICALDRAAFFDNLIGRIELDERAYKICNPHLNIWKSIDLGQSEVRHCAFLGWLFDRRADHYQKDLFLQCFLEAFPEMHHLIQLAAQSTFSVAKEDYDSELGRTDITISSRDFIIVIEAKIAASEQEDQIGRYREVILAKATALSLPPDNCQLVFLTMDGREPETGKADLCISWGDVAKVCQRFIKGCENTFVNELVRQYARFLEKEL